MVVIGYDRFNVIVRGFKGQKITPAVAFLILVSIWAYSVGVCIPPFFGWGGYALGNHFINSILWPKKFQFCRGPLYHLLLWLFDRRLESQKFPTLCFHFQLLRASLVCHHILHPNRQSCGLTWGGFEGPSQENECWQSEIQCRFQRGIGRGADCQSGHYQCLLVDLYLDTLRGGSYDCGLWGQKYGHTIGLTIGNE